MELIKKIIHIIANISYVLILLFLLVESPMLFGYEPLVVLSGSMEPTYKVGSIVYYHEVPEEELQVGDAITYELDDGTFITHRINSIEDHKYRTKGDANNSVDPVEIEYSSIKGKVANVSIPFMGTVFVQFLNHHTLIIGILVVILVSEFLLTNVKAFDIDKSKKERSKKDEKEKN